MGSESENKGEKPPKKTQINYEFRPQKQKAREFQMSEKFRLFQEQKKTTTKMRGKTYLPCGKVP